MAISFVGASAGASTTAVIPAHAAGDTIYVFAWVEASTTNPTVPAGYTTISNTVDGLAQSISFGYRVATGTSDGSNTWTNATQMAVGVYRGQNPSGGAFYGAWVPSAAAASSTSAFYAAIPSFSGVTGSWLVGFGAHRSTNTNINTAPTGLTGRASLTGGGEVGIFDSNGIKTSWASQNVALGGTANNWQTIILELLAGTAYTYSGTVEAEPVAGSYVTIHKVLNLEYGNTIVSSDSAYAKGTSGPTAHPYSGTVEVEPSIESVLRRNKSYSGSPESDVDASTVHSRSKSYVGTVEADVAAQASPGKGKRYTGSVEAEPVADSVVSKGKGIAGSVASDVESDSAYAYAAGQSAPVDHPYVGTVEADAVVESDRYKQLVRDGSVEADVDATTVHSRLKSYVGAVEGEVVAQATPAKRKSYTASAEIDVALDSERAKGKYKLGSVESEVVAGSDRYKNIVRDGLNESRIVSDSAYALAASGGTAHPYVGTVEAIVVESADRYRAKDYAGSVQGEFAVDSVRYKGKVYTGDLSTVIVLDSVYAKATQGANVYVGKVEANVQGSSRIAVGKAYRADTNLIVVIGGVPLWSHPTAHPYAGNIFVTVETGTTDLFHSGLIVVPTRETEPLPVTVWSVEGQPTDGYVQEPMPGYPGSQDGAWTMEGQDGAVTEPPAQGAYTDIGYFKEFKPFRRYTHVNESAPGRGASIRGAQTSTTERGAWTELGERGAYTQDNSYVKEIKPQ